MFAADKKKTAAVKRTRKTGFVFFIRITPE